MVPKGPPVLVATSKVPAECQLRGGGKEGVGSGSSFGIAGSGRGRDRAKKKGEGAYARRSMSGAQFFSAMRPRSLRLALSTALR